MMIWNSFKFQQEDITVKRMYKSKWNVGSSYNQRDNYWVNVHAALSNWVVKPVLTPANMVDGSSIFVVNYSQNFAFNRILQINTTLT